MIIRTYQRRNRIGRSLSESGNPYGDGVGSSGSQESLWGSSQEPFSFPSSQESSWSQSDYGNSNRSFKSSRRQSQDDDFNDDPMAILSRPPLSRSFSERPPLNSTRSNDAKKLFRGKLKKAVSELPDLYSDGIKGTSSREMERRRCSDIYDTDGQEIGAGSSRIKRGSVWVDAFNNAVPLGMPAPPTSTLMEAQESGEMMEHVDEANFALDGLRQGQPVRVQRASLTSLLSLCGSMQRRRMLRTHGMAKPLLDAIIALPTDDPPLALAAAAVLYLLASDNQDEDLLDSEPCVLFLMKLLGACPSQPVVKKGLSAIGSRLAALSKATLPKVGVDRGAAVVSKVRDLFKTLQEHSGGGGNPNEENGDLLVHEISSKWLALLTLEKACISTVILEDSTAEAVRKVGGRFKERLRELGGLDTVCNLAASCLVNLREVLKSEDVLDLDLASLEKNENSGGVGLLLRCLRVMENVTLFSEQNQKHLLELKLSGGKVDGSESFIGLTISAINTLSELARRQKGNKVAGAKPKGFASFAFTEKETPVATVSSKSEGHKLFVGIKGRRQKSLSEFSLRGQTPAVAKDESEKAQPSSSSKTTSSVITFQRRKFSKFESVERGQVTSVIAVDSQDTRSEAQNIVKVVKVMSNRVPVSQSEISWKSVSGSEEYGCPKQSDIGLDWKDKNTRCKDRKRSLEETQDPFAFDDMVTVIKDEDKKGDSNVEDSQDPFAFDTVDLDFKTDIGAKKRPKKEKSGKPIAQAKRVRSRSRLGAEEVGVVLEASNFGERSESLARSDSESQVEGSRQGTLLGDCLLSGVKVLMNLTNGNPLGCFQVATCNGFDLLSSLLVANYPWPRLDSLDDSQDNQDMWPSPVRQSQGDSDQDLDLVVSVLGVLCNLVEKDISNRARLASLEVAVPPDITMTKEGKLWEETGMIGLLCSLFLMKQGAGEAAQANETKRALEIDDEVKQGQAEAEDMIVEAYTALLLGFLSKESDRARTGIAQLLPGDDLKVLVPVLERFVAFHLELNMISSETHALVTDVIDSCKQPISSRPVT